MQSSIIRLVEDEDAKFVQQYASDFRVASTCNLPSPYPENGGKEWVHFVRHEGKRNGVYAFAIISNEHFAGVIGLLNVNRSVGTCNVGYWLGRTHWGKGLATKALESIIDYAFNELDLHTIFAECLIRNEASKKVLEKNNFTIDSEFILEDGKFKGEKAICYVRLR